MRSNPPAGLAPTSAAIAAAACFAVADPARAGTLEDDFGITGDWWGFRQTLADRGVSFQGSYVAEVSGVLDGGLRRRGSFRNLLTLELEIDLQEAIGLPGATVFAQFLSVNPDRGGSRDSGDLQVYTNIEVERHIDALTELWYQQTFLDGALRFKLGKLDANSEFAFVEAGEEFAHSSAGFSPTIFTLPTYPESATSVNVFVRTVETHRATLTLGYGLYDGATPVDGIRTGARGPATFFSDRKSDDLFHIGQCELIWCRGGGHWFTNGRAAVGGWLHTGEFERFDGGTRSDTSGLFVVAEQQLFDPHDDDRGVYLFAQYAWADRRVSEVVHHAGLGLVQRGTFPGREGDSAGVYASLAVLSDAPGADFGNDELAIDVYYRLRLGSNVYVQPELQWIINPAADPDARDALVGGIRVGIEF